MPHQQEDSRTQAQSATAGLEVGQRQQGVSAHGLLEAAVVEIRQQLPGLRGRGAWTGFPQPRGAHPNRVSPEVERGHPGAKPGRPPPGATSGRPRSWLGRGARSAPVGVNTFHVGTLKGVGRIYMQAAIDCHSLRLGPMSVHGHSQTKHRPLGCASTVIPSIPWPSDFPRPLGAVNG